MSLPRKLIDDLKATAGGIAAAWWMLAAVGRYGKVMETHHGYTWRKGSKGIQRVLLGSLKGVC